MSVPAGRGTVAHPGSAAFWRSVAGPVAIGLVLLVVLPLAAPDDLFDLTLYAIFGILAMSLGFVWGFGGILCFGQAAFFGLGAYAYAITAINTGDMYLGILLAVGVPALFATLLGVFMFYGRLSDVYVGIVTLVVTLIFQRFLDQTAGDDYVIGAARLGGFNGIPSFPTLHWPGSPDAILSETDMFVGVMGLGLLVYLGLRLLLASRFGRVLVAVRENEQRAGLLGYDVRRVKTLAFAVGGGVAGLAGCLLANATYFIDPKLFSLQQTAEILIWVLVGGLGTLVGPVIGALLLGALAKALGSGSLGIEADPLLVTGAILVLFVLVVPRGLVPTAALLWHRRHHQMRRHRMRHHQMRQRRMRQRRIGRQRGSARPAGGRGAEATDGP